MTTAQVYFEDIEPGMKLPSLVKHPNEVQLFRYSAVTWNPHRIHFDQAYARVEGYPGVLVQAHLHGCFLSELVMKWIGPRGRLVKFGWQNRRFAIAGDQLTCTGVVKGKYVENGRSYVELELEERNQRDEVCAPGHALVVLPLAADGGK